MRSNGRLLEVSGTSEEILSVAVREDAGHVAGAPQAAVRLHDLLSGKGIATDADGGAFGDFGRDAKPIQFVGDPLVGPAAAPPGVHLQEPTFFLRARLQAHDFFVGLGIDATGTDGNFAVGDSAAEFALGALVCHAGADVLGDVFAVPFGDREDDFDDELTEKASGAEAVTAQIDDVDGDAEFAQAAHEEFAIEGITAEAVDLGDDEVADGGRALGKELDGVEEELAAGTLAKGNATGSVFVGELEVVAEVEALLGSVGRDALVLGVERSILLVGRDTAVEGRELGI